MAVGSVATVAVGGRVPVFDHFVALVCTIRQLILQPFPHKICHSSSTLLNFSQSAEVVVVEMNLELDHLVALDQT